MPYTVETDDYEIRVTDDGIVVAEFGSGSGVVGNVFEPDEPRRRMHSSALLAIAKFFIKAAETRAEEEIEQEIRRVRLEEQNHGK